MVQNEIDAIRALLSAKPRPVGWAERRARIEEVGSVWPVADDVELTAVDAGGVPGEWSTVSGSDRSRVLLFFHGGGYCSGSIRSHRRLVTEAGRVVAPFLMTRAVLPTLLAQRWGRIINVTTSLDIMWRGMMQPYGASKAANEAMLAALAQELDGTGVTANVLVPGGAADTRMVSRTAVPDRSTLIAPEVMVKPLVWLCSNASDGVNGQRFIAAKWDTKVPPEQAAKNAAAPAAWQQLGRQSINPEGLR